MGTKRNFKHNKTMKKEFTPIAMRCTKEQFEAIKPKLENFEKEIGGFGSLPYLTNFLHGIENNIGNIFESCKGDYKREVHEKWNEKVFLEACGISTVPTLEEVKEYFKDAEKVKNGDDVEGSFSNADEKGIHFWHGMYWIDDKFNQNVWLWDSKGGYAEILTYKEKTYSLTKEQLRSLTDPQVKEWFPEVFETVLPKDFTGWTKHTEKNNNLWTCYFENGNFVYGIGSDGEWFSRSEFHDFIIIKSYREATESEVFEALKNEAVKRGYKNGNYECLHFPTLTFDIVDEKYSYNKYDNTLHLGYGRNNVVFKQGQWAEIIPTLTRKEAENKLGVKIVD